MSTPFWDLVETGYEGADYATSPWDLLVLNGEKVPGKSQVRCVPRKKIDIQKPNGSDGAALIERGHEPARVDIEITIWTPSQWRLLQELMGKIWRRAGKPSGQDRAGSSTAAVKRSGAIGISHPACGKPFDVNAIVIESIESPEDGPETGTKVVRIRALQFIPPKTGATRRADGSGKKVPLAPEFQATKNTLGRPPSVTDASPRAPTAPAQGSS